MFLKTKVKVMDFKLLWNDLVVGKHLTVCLAIEIQL